MGTIRVAIHLEDLCKQARDHCALLVHNQWPPGFRFFPTDEELVVHYLCKKAASQIIPVSIIVEVYLYKYDPWQLPGISLFFVFPLRLILVYLNRF